MFCSTSKNAVSSRSDNDMAIRKINNTWIIDIRVKRQRFRKVSPENSRAGAKAYESHILQQLARGIDPFQLREEKKILTLKDFSARWMTLYVETNNKISGVRNKTSIFNTHLIPFMGAKKLNEITSMLIEQYKASATAKGLCSKTVNNHLTVLHTCLTYAVEWGELDAVPKIKKLKVTPQRFDFLTFEESANLINTASGLWKDMVTLALNTGMRFGEIRALEWTDINWSKRQICVKKAFYRNILGSTKSQKERFVPISSNLFYLLELNKKSRGYIFANSKGDFLEENEPRRALKKITKTLHLDNKNGRRIGWHALRHTFASHLAMKGAPLSVIQQLLGHSNIQTTMRYAHLMPSAMEQAIELLDANSGNENFGQYMGRRQNEAVGNRAENNLNDLNLSLTIKQKQDLAVLPCTVEMAGVEPASNKFLDARLRK